MGAANFVTAMRIASSTQFAMTSSIPTIPTRTIDTAAAMLIHRRSRWKMLWFAIAIRFIRHLSQLSVHFHPRARRRKFHHLTRRHPLVGGKGCAQGVAQVT